MQHDTTGTDRSKIRKELWKYYAYCAFSALGILNPFLILFLVDQGVNFTTISLGASVMATTTILAEIPSGYLGDRIGRRRLLILSKTSAAISTSLWFFADSLSIILVIYFLQGLGISLSSGSDSAWLYDLLDEHEAGEDYTEVSSRGQSISHWTYGLTGIIGAYLYLSAPASAFVVAAAGAWIAVLIVMTFPENVQYSREDESPSLSVTESAVLTKEFLSKKGTRPLILLGAIMAGAMYTGSQFIQPLVTTAVPGNDLSIWVGEVPEVLLLGILYAVLSGITGTIVSQADWLKQLLGVSSAVVTVYAIGAAAMILPVVHPLFIIPGILIFRSVPMIAAPIRNGYLHEHADTAGRATEMSAITFFYAIARIPVLLVAGRIADFLSPLVAFGGLGVYVVVASGIVILGDRPLTVSSEPEGEPL